jgi:hypothetical protein
VVETPSVFLLAVADRRGANAPGRSNERSKKPGMVFFRFLGRAIVSCDARRQGKYAAGPFCPSASVISTVDGCASRMVAKPKRKRMRRSSKIEAVNIRRNRFGLTGIVYSDGYAYAVRFAPNTAVTETLVRKLWRESRRSFQRYNDSTDEILY